MGCGTTLLCELKLTDQESFDRERFTKGKEGMKAKD